jgi:hypothetical protein
MSKMTIMPSVINLDMDYRFTLLKGSKKMVCPSCQKKTLVNYFDNNLKEVLPIKYGRCDREDKCAYHLSPYKDGYLSSILKNNNGDLINNTIKNNNFLPNRQIEKLPQYFDFEVYKKALNPKRLKENTFFKNLIKIQNQSSIFIEELYKVFDKYKIGTVIVGYWKGAVTFPYIDLFGNIRTVQLKTFDENNKTVLTNKLDKVIISELKKEQKAIPEWLKKHVEYGDEYGYFTCLFGEHLLGLFPNNPIALVEAPKTAIYCSLYFGLPKKKDDLIFLAVYNKSSFSLNKIKVLEGRKVFVFPDLSKKGDTFNVWQEKAKQYEKQLKNTHFIFSDLLEKYATDDEKDKGLDIADFLIKQDWLLFRKNSKNLSESQFIEHNENEQHPPTTEELLNLAENIIGFNNSKQKTEIPYFEEMMEFRIIKESKPVLGYYYLSQSTPF